MKKKLTILLFVITLPLIFVACDFSEEGFSKSSNNNSDTTKETEKTGSISKEYWGSWIRMDTGDEYYVDSSNIYKSSSSNKKYSKIQSGTNGFSLDGENVLVNGNYRYFKKGGGARSFSLTTSGFSDSYSRAASIGQQGISGRRKNQNNSADSESKSSDSNGKLEFKEAVADDKQEITISSGSKETKIEVTPQYDGENVGSVPLVETGKYGFKTTYSIDGDKQGFCYGNLAKKYSLNLTFKNIGTEDCATSVYTISCDDLGLKIDGDLSGNFSTITAGSSKSVIINVMYSEVTSEYVDVPVKISITDRKYERTWNDSVTLRFYKGVVNVKVNARNFNANSNSKLNGFFIYPDGRSQRFTVSNGYSNTLTIPWSEKDYILAFSGATADNEMAYSFAVNGKTNVADLSGVWSVADMNAYKSNTTATAYKVDDLSKPVKAYLGNGDVEFFTLNVKECEIRFEPVTYVSYQTKEYENGNNDGLVTPGESHYLDVKLKNNTATNFKNVTVKLTTTSSYVTLVRDSYVIGDMTAGYYYSLTDYASSINSCYLMSSYYSSNAFKFKVSSDCPDGTQLPFALTFTDSSGKTWSDSFTVPVSTTKAKIELESGINYSVKEYENGNSDGLVTPGESHYLDVKFKNSGSSAALGVTVKLTTTSSYVTVVRDSYVIGDMTAGYYYSLTDYASSIDSCYLMSSYYSSNAFKFKVSSDCPDGTVIPFILTFTDQSGNTWTDSFSITVTEADVKMVVSGYSFSDSTSISSALNNGDEGINAGEKINLDIRVQNTGTAKVLGVIAKLTSTSPYIIFSDNISDYGDITGGYYKTSYNASGNNGYSSASSASYSLVSYPGYVFTISSSTPANTVIPITVTMTDKQNHSWSDTINLKVVESVKNVEVVKVKTSDPLLSGYMNNNNGLIEAGEKIYLDLCIKNTGTSKLSSLNISLSSTSSYVTFSNSSRSYGDLSSEYYSAYSVSGTSKENSYVDKISPTSSCFVLTVYSSTPAGTVIPIKATLKDSSNNTWNHDFDLIVN